MRRFLVERTSPDSLAPPADKQSAQLNNLPVDRISEVRVLDPYFHR